MAVPAHHPIKWACIKKSASHIDNSGPNNDKIGAEVMIGCIPIKPKIQTIKGSRIIIAQKGKLFPILFYKVQNVLLLKFRDIENEKSNPTIKKFFQKAKNFWGN